MKENLYDILGLSKSASSDDIRKAYRKLARKYHPDVNPGDKEAEATFKKVAAAYDVLGDDEKRKLYDEFGEESLAGGFDPEKARAYQSWKQARSQGARPFRGQSSEGVEFDFGDLFGFAGGADVGGGAGFGRRGRGRGPVRGPDMHAMVDMDLRQAITGGEVSLDVPGKGPVKVRIPPGADSGSVIRLRGKGAPGPQGGQPGDLVIETRVKPHPRVKREGLDLHLVLPVTLDEAYNGATVEVPTFTTSVKLRIPPLTQPGAKLRVRGHGVPRKDKKGDLIVELDVRLPDKASDELAEAIKASRDAYSIPVRKELVL